jgi:hypothetical protein
LILGLKLERRLLEICRMRTRSHRKICPSASQVTWPVSLIWAFIALTAALVSGVSAAWTSPAPTKQTKRPIMTVSHVQKPATSVRNGNEAQRAIAEMGRRVVGTVRWIGSKVWTCRARSQETSAAAVFRPEWARGQRQQIGSGTGPSGLSTCGDKHGGQLNKLLYVPLYRRSDRSFKTRDNSALQTDPETGVRSGDGTPVPSSQTA